MKKKGLPEDFKNPGRAQDSGGRLRITYDYKPRLWKEGDRVVRMTEMREEKQPWKATIAPDVVRTIVRVKLDMVVVLSDGESVSALELVRIV